MSRLQDYIKRYGDSAGPRLYHALQSRSAYIGANQRRRQTIRALTGETARPKPSAVAKADGETPLLPGFAAAAARQPGAEGSDAESRSEPGIPTLYAAVRSG